MMITMVKIIHVNITIRIGNKVKLRIARSKMVLNVTEDRKYVCKDNGCSE